MRWTRGFTLIEMAIVLVVIGMIVSGGLFIVSDIASGARRTETDQKLDVIERALIVYAIQNSCLPCPADRNMASSGTNPGQAHHNGSTNPYYTTGCTGADTDECNSTIGVVPWRNLGLSEQDIVDAWGTRISYSIGIGADSGIEDTDGMVRTPPSDYTPPGTIDVNAAAGGVITSDAAYVLVSHGKDRAFGYSAITALLQNDTHGSGATDPQPENGDTDEVFVQDDLNEVANEDYFDDIVRFRTKPLIVQLCGKNACGNPE